MRYCLSTVIAPSVISPTETKKPIAQGRPTLYEPIMMIFLQAVAVGESIFSHEAETLWHRSQALRVMNCLLDIYPSKGGIAVVQHGTATAAIL